MIPLAITEAYQDQNLWWQPDRGGAPNRQRRPERRTAAQSTMRLPSRRKTESRSKPGSIRSTHLLYRTVEENSTQTITTTYSDYAPVDGVMMAKKLVVDDGSHNLQTFTLTSAKFSESLPLSAYQRPAENLHDFSIAGGAHETTVPFHLWNNHIYADVSVNGSKPMTFIFDTGGHSILAPATAKALGVEAKGNLSSTGGGDKIATSGEAMVKSLTVGGATITDQPVTTLDTAPAGTEGANEKGMIGYEFFARFITRFDYGRHTITFIEKKYFDPKTAGIASADAPLPSVPRDSRQL